MNKSVAIIVGGTGQFGRILSGKLIKKKYKVVITTRSLEKANLKFKSIKLNTNKNLTFKKLDVLKKNKIKSLLIQFNPKLIFFFAGQGSPKKSFYKKKETYLSNFIGCKNFLEVILKNKIQSKFLNATSCEIYANTKRKINLKSKKKPISPYGIAKLKSYNITKKFRKKYNLQCYNAIIFNTESTLREKNYLIPKICLAAINAKKFGKKTEFGNLKIAREWNWCPEQCEYILKFLSKKPQDFILSNGKMFTAMQMIKFAFDYLNINFRDFILINKKFFRKADFTLKKSDFKKCLRRNNLKRKSKIYGKTLIQELIKYYQNENKY